MSDSVRMAVGAAIVWYALGMPGLPGGGGGGGGLIPEKPYTGSLTALHQAGKSMKPEDRSALAAGFAAGADMLAADAKGLVDTNEEAQTFVVALLEFNYNGLGKPSQSYPDVLSAVESEFQSVVGDDTGPLPSAKKSALIASMREMAAALGG